MELDKEQYEALCEAFPKIKLDRAIKSSDLQKALEVLGCPIPGFEARDIVVKQLKNDDEISLKKLTDIYEDQMEKKHPGFSKANLGGQIATDLKVVTADISSSQHEAKHTVSYGEAQAYSDWLNRCLKKDPDCKAHLPVKASDLYEKCKDGVLLCKLINHSVAETIDQRALNVGKDATKVFKQNENRVLAVNSAAAIGVCVVNIGPGDIAEGREHLVLGLLWQVIRIGLLRAINLAYCKELAALLREGETLDDLRQLSPEELLIRWVNYHLEKSGCNRRINNFKEDIMDSVAYAHLLSQICPSEKRSNLTPPTSISNTDDTVRRAEMVLKNADAMDVACFLQPIDIAKANEKGKNFREKLNLAFVANLFNNYPALTLTEDIEVEIEETLEEKTYRNWINSMPGNKPFVNDLYADLRNGLVLLTLFDEIKPGCVDWSKVCKEFDPKKKLFQMQDNCLMVVKCAKECNLSIVNLGAEDLREGVKNLSLGLVFQMMKAYTLKILMQLKGDGKPIDDSEIIDWANEKLKTAGRKSSISSFKDQKLVSSVIVLELIDAIVPNTINFNEISNDHLLNAKYAISMARRAGARAYTLPEHIVELNKNMILSLFACLMVLDYKIKQNKL